jgi:hypothetical protein
VTEVVAETTCEVTVKVVEVAFAATVTLAGTEAAALLSLDSRTTAPPVPARPLRLTVAVELEDPPTTAVGDRVSDWT